MTHAAPTADPTEPRRREMLIDINTDPRGRAALEAEHGEVWAPDEVRRDFELIEFSAPLVVARRRSDEQLGSLKFQHAPRFYFGWQPHED